MERNVFKKARLAAVIALASSTLTLTGCLVEGDESDSVSTSSTSSAVGNNHERVTAPVGTVQGVVQDTNGNPIAGAKVFVGSMETETSLGGTYEFKNVAVSQVKVTGQNEDYAGQAVQIVVVPPEGYLGATVTVKPSAVIDDGRSETAETETSTASTNTFIDGFTATAGTAVLPKLSATVKGSVREEHNGSHEALIGKSIALDMYRVNGTYQQQSQNGVNTSYQTLDYSAVISADGSFEIANVPADSQLRFVFDSYVIKEGATSVETTSEQLPTNIGTIGVSEIVSNDTIAPYVIGVDNVIALASTVGLLKDDVTNQIVIRFSESLNETEVDAGELSETNSVRVYNRTSDSYIRDGKVSVSGNALTLDFTETLTAGSELEISLLAADFVDLATIANSIKAGTAINFDSDFTSQNSNKYVRLKLQVFAEDQMTGEVVSVQLLDDTAENNEHDLIQQSNTVFQDVNDELAGFQQLNSQDDDDNLEVDTKVRLTALASELARVFESSNNSEAEDADKKAIIAADEDEDAKISVNVDVARVQFAPINAAHYELAVTDKSGNTIEDVKIKLALGANKVEQQLPQDEEVVADDPKEIKPKAMIKVETNSFEFENLVDGYAIQEDGTGVSIEFLLTNVKPGYNLHVTSFDDLGYPVKSDPLMLRDRVGPTTILQDSYDIHSHSEKFELDSGVVGFAYGNGGEQSGEPAAAYVGVPYLNLTPRLLGEVDGTEPDSDDDGISDANSFNPLYAMNLVNNTNRYVGKVAPGAYFINPESNTYDETAIEKYLANSDFKRTIGVAFSEDVSLIENTTPVFESVLQTAQNAPSNYVAKNDVATNDIGGADPYSDLVRFDVANIHTFAKEESGSVINFVGAVQDQANQPNPATSNAKVMVRDLIPALVTSANYYGDTLVVEFDKAIRIDEAVSITLGERSIKLDPAMEGEYSISEDGTVLTINAVAWETYAEAIEDDIDDDGQIDFWRNPIDSTLSFSNDFKLGQFSSQGTIVEDEGTRYTRARLDFSNIESRAGVSWSDYNKEDAKYFFEPPKFAAVNQVSDLDVTVTANKVAENQISLTVNTNHRLYFDGYDVSNAEFIPEVLNYSGADITAAEPVTITVTSENGISSYEYKTVITVDGTVTDGSEISFDSPWTSRFDTTVNVVSNPVVVTSN